MLAAMSSVKTFTRLSAVLSFIRVLSVSVVRLSAAGHDDARS
jgi:hypothetical protein